MSEFISFSQSGQDLFCFKVLKGKSNGVFIDVGCGPPATINNTWALEQLGWTGMLIESSESLAREIRSARKSYLAQADSRTINWPEEMYRAMLTSVPVIDYLSLDVDESSLETLLRFPFKEWRCRVITVEHDSYRFGHIPKTKQRKHLSSLGYELIASDVSSNGYAFEDWWVHPSLVDMSVADRYRSNGLDWSVVLKKGDFPITASNYFDKIFCINLDSREDRWTDCLKEFERHKIQWVERFPGVIPSRGKDGNFGCTASHRALLDIIVYHQWPRVLVLEDDFKVLHEDFSERFALMVSQVPYNWDMLYLGGQYGSPPIKRIAPCVIKFDRMLMTSSYGITSKYARDIAPFIYGDAGIDSLYSHHAEVNNCFILSPRLIVQRESYSDIRLETTKPEASMLDTRHESMV